MGLLFSRVFNSLFGSKEVRILVLGLDNAGKTTILYKLHDKDSVVTTQPTIGFNVESIQFKNVKLQVWDLGGQSSIRPFWRCYFPNTSGIIFVVDSSDTERMEIARKELMAILEEEELDKTVLLVLANKQDQPNALSAAEVSEGLGLTTIKNRRWHICKTAAIRNEGLTEGLDWLVDALTS